MLRTVPLVFAAIGLVGQATSGDAAEFRIHIDLGQHREYRDARGRAWETGYERGFDEGFREGRRAARRHRDNDRWRHSRFRDGTSRYRSRDGRRDAYVHGYRAGFESGYTRAYREYRRDDRNGRRAIRNYDRGHRHNGRSELCYLRH